MKKSQGSVRYHRSNDRPVSNNLWDASFVSRQSYIVIDEVQRPYSIGRTA